MQRTRPESRMSKGSAVPASAADFKAMHFCQSQALILLKSEVRATEHLFKQRSVFDNVSSARM